MLISEYEAQLLRLVMARERVIYRARGRSKNGPVKTYKAQAQEPGPADIFQGVWLVSWQDGRATGIVPILCPKR